MPALMLRRMKGLMTNVAEKISQSQIWSVLYHLRNELQAHDISVTLAALLYLRWADFQEAEQEAIAAFDEADYNPVLPAALRADTVVESLAREYAWVLERLT